MRKISSLPNTVAIFPLSGALLLPKSQIPLNVFEPRYLQMVDDALKTSHRLIGMIQPNEVGGRKGNGLHVIGCAGRITQFSETEDNNYLVTLTGISRFRVMREVEDFVPYRRCDVSWNGFERDRGQSEANGSFDRTRFLHLLDRYFKAYSLSADWVMLKEVDDELLINSLSMMLDFKAEDKQALLEAPSLGTRCETLVTLIEFALRGGDGDVMQ